MSDDRSMAFARFIKKLIGPGPLEMGLFYYSAKWAFNFSVVTWILYNLGLGNGALTFIPSWVVCFYLLTEISESEI